MEEKLLSLFLSVGVWLAIGLLDCPVEDLVRVHFDLPRLSRCEKVIKTLLGPLSVILLFRTALKAMTRR